MKLITATFVQYPIDVPSFIVKEAVNTLDQNAQMKQFPCIPLMSRLYGKWWMKCFNSVPRIFGAP